MSKPWKKSRYTQAAKELKRLGYSITYKGNDRKTFTQRGIIRRLYDEKAAYIVNSQKSRTKDIAEFGKDNLPIEDKKTGNAKIKQVKYKFKFQKLTTAQKRLAKKSGLFSPKQFTKGGVFIDKPANIPTSNYKIKFNKNGKVRLTSKGRERSDVLIRLDNELLAIDPAEAIRQAKESGRGASFFSLMVNGFNFKAGELPMGMFNSYLGSLVAEYQEQKEIRESKNGEVDQYEFTDIFHLKMISYNK